MLLLDKEKMHIQSLEKITWQVIDGVGHMILHDPPSNKMSISLFSDLCYLVKDVIPESHAKAIVIYGSGRHFSSGADLDELLCAVKHESERDTNGRIVGYPKLIKEIVNAFSFFDHLTIPVIGGVCGVCLGSGLELALCCHIRLCGIGAVLGSPESTFNLMPGCGATLRLPRTIGFRNAMELIFRGKNLTAEEAKRLGIVHALLPKRQVVECAVDLAKRIAEDYDKSRIALYIEHLH